MSNLALGYLYFENINSTLAERCYTDLRLVFDRLYTTYPTVATLSDAGGYGMMLIGFSNAWKAFTDHHADHGDDATRVSNALTRVQGYTATFLANQTGGAWSGANGIQEHLKRNFGILKAFDVTGNMSYLDAVADNIDYILATFWIPSNGGLEWYSNPAASDHFYECHQQWFMIAVRMLYDASAGVYDYTDEGLQAWLFMTDNNYTNIDMYVHNLINHGAFFGYRQITSGGVIQVDGWKGSYEIGTALWGMALNYDWVSDYQSSHSPQAYNYLGEMVSQIKNTPAQRGFFNEGNYVLNTSLWSVAGSPSYSIISHNGNPVASFLGYGSHDQYIASTYNSFDNKVLEMKVNMTVDQNNNCTPEVGFRVTDNNNRYITMLRGNGVVVGGVPIVGDLFIRRYQGGSPNNPTSYPVYDYTANHYYKYKITANGNVITQYLDDVPVRTWNDAGSAVMSGRVSLTNYGGTSPNPVYYDDVRIRAYADADPVATPGTEEGDGKIWTGTGGNNNWNTAANWNPEGIPTASDNVNIPPGTPTAPRIQGAPPAVCYDMNIQTGATLTISPSGDLTVNGSLVNSGTLNITSTGVGNGGSLIVYGSSQGIVSFNRFLRPDDVAEEPDEDRHFFSPPVGGMTIENFTALNGSRIQLSGTDYQIWEYNEPDNSWPLKTSDIFESARGYNLDQAAGSNGLMTFIGTVVNNTSYTATSPYATGYTARATSDDYNVNASWSGTRSWTNYGGGGWNLMGNPFASALDAEAFISGNAGKFDPHYEALYVYDGINDRYNWVAAAIPGYPMQGEFGAGEVMAGQGFYVLALYDQAVFNFTPAMQVHGAPTLYLLKSAVTEEAWPGLQLTATKGTNERSLMVVYGDGMTSGNDPGYDVGLLSASSDLEIYTSLVNGDVDVNLARQALPFAEIGETVIPVGVDAGSGGEVTFSAFTVPSGSNRYWLHDKLTGSYTDLTLNSYTVTLPAQTYGTGRFFIIASASTPTNIKPEAETEGLRIWNSAGKVVIRGSVSEMAVCEVIDLQGKTVLKTRLADGDLNTVSVPSGMHGVYIVRITDRLKITIRKVAIL
jgi:hypothetical protein